MVQSLPADRIMIETGVGLGPISVPCLIEMQLVFRRCCAKAISDPWLPVWLIKGQRQCQAFESQTVAILVAAMLYLWLHGLENYIRCTNGMCGL
jgi:hypothetical protein